MPMSESVATVDAVTLLSEGVSEVDDCALPKLRKAPGDERLSRSRRRRSQQHNASDCKNAGSRETRQPDSGRPQATPPRYACDSSSVRSPGSPTATIRPFNITAPYCATASAVRANCSTTSTEMPDLAISATAS